jgi:hypothetical protein
MADVPVIEPAPNPYAARTATLVRVRGRGFNAVNGTRAKGNSRLKRTIGGLVANGTLHRVVVPGVDRALLARHQLDGLVERWTTNGAQPPHEGNADEHGLTTLSRVWSDADGAR